MSVPSPGNMRRRVVKRGFGGHGPADDEGSERGAFKIAYGSVGVG